mmetsp:Transcript_29307/g.76971  ORF Transcript_29307/g.76971 Transcript_29307/m.76971 type:complete len:134 (+) Transcript_29307:145-546(+)
MAPVSNPSTRRARLTEKEVAEIFDIKNSQAGSNGTPSAAGVARIYGINEKTVRDIWKGRTWNRKTWLAGSFRKAETSKEETTALHLISIDKPSPSRDLQIPDEQSIDSILFSWEVASRSCCSTSREESCDVKR